MGREISQERKNAYYAGLGISAVGILLIITGIISFISGRNSASAADITASIAGTDTSAPASFVWGIIGMSLVVAGRLIGNTEAKSIADGEFALESQQPGENFEPFSRVAVRLSKDPIDQMGVAASAAAKTDFDGQLRKLHKLREDGIISQQEYDQAKARILEREM